MLAVYKDTTEVLINKRVAAVLKYATVRKGGDKNKNRKESENKPRQHSWLHKPSSHAIEAISHSY